MECMDRQIAFGLPYLCFLEAFFHLAPETVAVLWDVEMEVEAWAIDLQDRAKALAHTALENASVVDHQTVLALE